MSTTKRRVYKLLDTTNGDDRASRIFGLLLIALIVTNLVAAILETVPSIGATYGRALQWFEVVSVIVFIFTVEYVLRVWCITEAPEFRHPVWGRLRYMVTPLALIDLAAILPFYLPMVGVDLRQVRVLRMFRLARAGKLARYSRSLQLIGRVMKKSRGELVATGGLMAALLVCASTALYFAERDAQPDLFSSIPAAMWWAVTTLTTVGYGDITPVTVLGRCLSAGVAILGIGLFALPTSVLGAAFLSELKERNAVHCPHCGESIHSS